jgi:hypothetical protein
MNTIKGSALTSRDVDEEKAVHGRGKDQEQSNTSDTPGERNIKTTTQLRRRKHMLMIAPGEDNLPPLRGLSFLDRFLVVWIILAMALGIVLGNTVDTVGPALQKGEFVGVSIPIGTCHIPSRRSASPAECFCEAIKPRGTRPHFVCRVAAPDPPPVARRWRKVTGAAERYARVRLREKLRETIS